MKNPLIDIYIKNPNQDEDFFGTSEEEWDWENFKSTEGFSVSKKLIEWVIGQDKAITETKLCVDEWIHKLNWLKEKKWWKPFEVVDKRREVKFFGRHLFYLPKVLSFPAKSKPKEYLPAGPFLMLLGDAGTGKSLIGRAMAEYLTEVYEKNNIKLYDVLTWPNKIMPSSPKISIHQTPEGSTIVEKTQKAEARKGWSLRFLFNSIVSIMLAFGGFIFAFVFGYEGVWMWYTNPHIYSMWGQDLGLLHDYYGGSILNFLMGPEGLLITNLQLIMMGIMALSMGGMLFIFMKMFGFMGGKGKQGIGGATATKAPKIVIDNSDGKAPFIDATGHGSAQLFGSIAWDPYQTGDLGTPEHQRVTAGDVHRAHLGVLYIDEIKNLSGAEAITLLTVLEDGQLSVALRSQYHGGDTAAMAVATEPIPCMNFLIAAGNMDSICMMHPALMDRIRGYGKVVYMNNDMDNNVENRRKYVQFISQEIKRFHLLPFSRDACISLIDEARIKSGFSNKLVTKFRPMISIIKTASILAMKEGLQVVERKHVECAINEHCKSVTMQYMETQVEKIKQYQYVDPKIKPTIGMINGLSVIHSDDIEGSIGQIMPLKAIMKKSRSGKEILVTGVNTSDSSWVQNSIKKVSSLVELKKGYTIHIDFAQSIGIDGPSAGIAMALLCKSVLFKKPIKQDVAVTGEINLVVNNEVLVTPVGGVHSKIIAAQMMGFSKVCIPKRNFELNVKQKDYTIIIVPCETLSDYEREVFA